jgi:hypothetical protein
MPVGKGGKYRVVETSKGPVRLHLTPKGTVNEAVNTKTGARHSPKEFAADRKASATRKSK